jgi:threonine dehydrogenase-like Zn-dependent dehydrogenase
MAFKKPKEVKAAVTVATGVMELRTFPYPDVHKDSAIIRVDMTGVCGTDKHIIKGDASEIRGKSLFPFIEGHEIIGTIVEIGEDAAKNMDSLGQLLREGDRVAVAVEVNCGKCFYCKNQYDNITCENQVMAYGVHPTCDTPPYLRGGFAEYMYIFPNSTLFKIPENMSTGNAVFVEEMAVAYSSLARAVQPFPAVHEGFGPGDNFVVLGNGPLGMLHGIMARIQGGGMSIATDLADYRLNATKVSEKERIEQVKELTHGVGADLVVESAGVPEAFIEALQMVRKGGTVIEVGNWVDTGQAVALNVMQHISSKEVHIHAVYHCGNKWAPVLTVMDRFAKQFPFEKMITHKMSLEEVIKKIGLVLDPTKCMKVEVVPHR